MIYCVIAESIGYKIGFTNMAINRRIGQIQNGCPAMLSLVFCLPGTRLDERSVHKHLAQYAMRGEWYSLDCGDFLNRFARDPELRNTICNGQPVPSIKGRKRRTNWEERARFEATPDQWRRWCAAARTVGMPVREWIVDVLDRAATPLEKPPPIPLLPKTPPRRSKGLRKVAQRENKSRNDAKTVNWLIK